ERAFPDDPNFKVLHALLHAVEGRMADAHELLDRAGQQLNPRQVATARIMAEMVEQMRHAQDAVSGAAGTSFGAFLARAPKSLVKIAATVTPDMRREATPTLPPLFLPLPGTVIEAYRQFPAVAFAFSFGVGYDRASAAMARAVRIHPDGISY